MKSNKNIEKENLKLQHSEYLFDGDTFKLSPKVLMGRTHPWARQVRLGGM